MACAYNINKTKTKVMKICKICKKNKPIEEFAIYKIKDTYEYRRHQCKRCHSIKSTAKRYDITIEQVVELKSKDSCEICNESINDWSQRYIDHNHDTGAVRGILCPRCNSVLELFESSKHLIQPSLDYLNKYN